MKNAAPFHLTDREKALEPLVRALESGFDDAAKSRLHNAAAATCIKIEQASGANLPAIPGYGGRIHFDAGIHGEALLAVDESGLARIGRPVSGLEQAEGAPAEAEILKAFLDFLAQGLDSSCRSFAQSCGLPIHCSAPVAVSPDGRRESISTPAGTFENARGLTFRLQVPDYPDILLIIWLQGGVLSSLNAQLPHYSAPAAAPAGNAAPRDKSSRWNMDLILDVELEVAVTFGATQMPLRDILKLGVGSVIELEKSANDPVEILVNEKPIARGEVVMVDGNYGVRVLEVESTADRIRSLG